jgi:diacylglycerol kinase family enzyme
MRLSRPPVVPGGPAIVVLNPRAGGGRARHLVGPISDWLARHAPRVRLHAVDGIEVAQAAVEAEPAGARVVVVGGDGTLHRMLPSLLDRACTLGIVPVGGGNDLARALGLDGLGWPQALGHALGAPAAPMDVGEYSDRKRRFFFASSLTAGFDSAVSLRAVLGPRWLHGLPRYLLATLREIAALQTWPVRVQADGELVHDGPALFVSVLNTPSYGGGMPAVPRARTDDGALDVLVAGAFTRLGTATMLPRLLAGRHLGHPRVRTRPFGRLAVEAGTATPIAGDGEPAGSADAWTIEVHPAALAVVRRSPDAARMLQP